MPIIKETKAQNGITVSYHKVIKFEVDFRTDTCQVLVHSWIDEASNLANVPLAWSPTIPIPQESMDGSGTIFDKLELALITAEDSPLKDGQITTDKSLDLATLKLRKNSEINRARLQANSTSFTYAGRSVAYDAVSQMDIAGTNGEITLTNAMPEGWVGGWKCIDNSYVPIPDIPTWISFYKSMTAQGKLNFKRAQDLKVLIAAADTPEKVEVINWNTPLDIGVPVNG